MDKMDRKGIVLNSAFAVSGAFVLGSHLAFTMAFDKTYIFAMILGSLLHFTYEWSNENSFVGSFSAINESTWEHLKLLFFLFRVIFIKKVKCFHNFV